MSDNRKKLNIFIASVAAVLLLVFLNGYFNKEGARNIFFEVAYFPERFLLGTGAYVRDVSRAVFSLKDILAENAALKSEKNELLNNVVGFENLKRENSLLRSQLNLKEKSYFKIQEARINSFDPTNLLEFVVLDKGLMDGIRKNYPVVFPGNILVGKVVDVYEEHSKVMLITDKNNKVNVKYAFREDEKVEGRQGYSGVINGHFGKSLFMDLIEKRSLVFGGDIIVTSGLDGVYPEGLIVGTIDVVKDEDDAVFKQAYLEPGFLNIYSTMVFIIRLDSE